MGMAPGEERRTGTGAAEQARGERELNAVSRALVLQGQSIPAVPSVREDVTDGCACLDTRDFPAFRLQAHPADGCVALGRCAWRRVLAVCQETSISVMRSIVVRSRDSAGQHWRSVVTRRFRPGVGGHVRQRRQCVLVYRSIQETHYRTASREREGFPGRRVRPGRRIIEVHRVIASGNFLHAQLRKHLLDPMHRASIVGQRHLSEQA